MDSDGPLEPTDVGALGERVARNVSAAVKAPPRVVRELLIGLLAGGHVLIEDYPGVGKTAIARALAASVEAEFARIQCTSDMLPSDLIGSNVYNQRDARFEFRPGAIFANLVLVDEINRASPKTQSGLLECMGERHVTVDGTTHELARPFLVLATQNPVEYEGTYPLPEAQLDRFMMRVSLGYPDASEEISMLAEHAARDRVQELRPVTATNEILAAQETVSHAHASEALRAYIVALTAATRSDPRTELGASPRAGLMLLRASMAQAVLEGRDHVLPDDVQELADCVLSHRLLLTARTSESERSAIVSDALRKVPAL